MKIYIVLTSLMLMSMSLTSQDAREILTNSREKCQAIIHGYYEMTTIKKYLGSPDTSMRTSTCYFKKHGKDLPFPAYLYARYGSEGNFNSNLLFTESELVNFSTKDSTGIITSLDPWKEHIEDIAHNYDFYDAFISEDSSPFPDDSTMLDSTYRLMYHGEERVGEFNCVHLESHQDVDIEGSAFEVLDFELHFWINTADMIPVQIAATYTLVMARDTMVQYDLLTLTRYEQNMAFEEEKISHKVIPPYCRLKEYTPYQSPEPLPLDTIAPGWSFTSLKDEVVSLESLKGQLVLIDFFYKSCMPCLQALPALQSLHEKYKDKGLVVIGLDPYDDKEDNLPAFLAKRDVDYTVLYASKEIAKTYRVSGYPTMYLIGKDGRILHVTEGYGDGVEAKLEKLILKHL